MKVLYFNWVDYLDGEKRGGGVSVYQRNLLAALHEQGGFEAHFLSSGISHELHRRTPRWVELPAVTDGTPVRRFEIVNAGLMAPSHADYGSPAQVEDPKTEAAFMDFVACNGPYDVIHFNNLEGLPANVLRVKERWPATRVVLSLHNYYPFCPQVNLWHDEAENCTDFAGGQRCETCLPVRANPRTVRVAHAVAWHSKRLGVGPGTFAFDRGLYPFLRFAWRHYKKLKLLRHRHPAPVSAPLPVSPPPLPAKAPLPASAAPPALVTVPASPPLPASAALSTSATPPTATASAPVAAPRGKTRSPFAARRAAMVSLINTHADAILCVSDRVRQIAAHHGLAQQKLHTSYIGTTEAAKWQTTQPKPKMLREDRTLRLAYLGYMRRDKGFFFLLDALEALPDALAACLRLTVAARFGDPWVVDRLRALGPRLAELRLIDGYTHAGLDALLADVDLGIVPVMWEDNLPQVAIEMHARHIPLLTSDRGGAQELGRCPALTFRAGDTTHFARVLETVLEERITPASYWKNAMPPVTMQSHLAQLLRIYENTP